MLVNIFFLLVILGLIFPKSRIISIAVFVLVWVLMWNETLLDYANYEYMYDFQAASDLGYQYLCDFFYNANLPFLICKVSLTGVATLLFCIFVLRNSIYPGFVASTYLLCCSVLDMEQFRNFISFSLVLTAIPLLFDNDNRKKIIYFGVVLLASSIHVSSLFFLIFGLLDRSLFNSTKKKVLAAVLLLVFYYIVSAYFLGSMEERLDGYSKLGTSTFTKTMLTLMMLINFIYIHYVTFKLPRTEMVNKGLAYLYNYNSEKTIYYLNIAIFLLLPLTFFSLTYARLYRYLAIVNCIYVSNSISTMQNNKYLHFVILFIYMLSFAGLMWTMHNHSLAINIFNLFNYNELIK